MWFNGYYFSFVRKKCYLEVIVSSNLVQSILKFGLQLDVKSLTLFGSFHFWKLLVDGKIFSFPVAGMVLKQSAVN